VRSAHSPFCPLFELSARETRGIVRSLRYLDTPPEPGRHTAANCMQHKTMANPISFRPAALVLLASLLVRPVFGGAYDDLVNAAGGNVPNVPPASGPVREDGEDSQARNEAEQERRQARAEAREAAREERRGSGRSGRRPGQFKRRRMTPKNRRSWRRRRSRKG